MPSSDADIKIAKLEAELSSIKAEKSHSTAKIVGICSVLAALVGASGFWQFMSRPKTPVPDVSQEDLSLVENRCYNVEQKQIHFEKEIVERISKVETNQENTAKAVDRLTPPHYTKIPK